MANKGGRIVKQAPGRGRRRDSATGRFVDSVPPEVADTSTHRTCRDCRVRKPMKGFHRDRNKKFGHAYNCKECEKLRRRQRSGMKLGAEQLMTLQEISGCEVCGSDSELCIDHNHDTGNVRGVLCGKCNRALGNALDDPTTLRGLADYLEERDGK